MNTDEELAKQMQDLLEKRGKVPLEKAREAVLNLKIKCDEVSQALKFFMSKYWHDLARPTLLSLCCEAVGGVPKKTIPFAVPLILIGGATDIHDDIIDRSKTKMSHNTVYGLFGEEIALLAGDALLFEGLILLNKASLSIPPSEANMIINIVEKMFILEGDAQALELSYRRRFDVSPKEYLKILEMKMSDVEAHALIGGIIGEASKLEIKALRKYGQCLGVTLAIRDDVVDMLNSEEMYHRLQYESLPLPILIAYQNPVLKPEFPPLFQSSSKRKIKKFLDKVEVSKAINESIDIMNKYGREALSTLDNFNSKSESLKLFVKAALHPFLKTF